MRTLYAKVLIGIFLLVIFLEVHPIKQEQTQVKASTMVSQSVTSTDTNLKTNTKTASYNIMYAFTKTNQHPEKLLIDAINTSEKTMDIAIYSITQKDIVNAIINAKKRGVIVRVITDKQESENKSQDLILSSFQKENIPVRVKTTTGLMHLKLTIIDNQIITVGSFNYTTQATIYNDEVILKINDKKIATDCETVFNEMWNNTKMDKAQKLPFVSGSIKYAFTKDNQHPEKLLIEAINSAKKSLDISIYSITHKDIINAIVNAKKRGVVVRVITDKTESKNKSQIQQLTILKNNDITVKIKNTNGLMHLKLTVIDNSSFAIGSFNYTYQASTNNDEILLLIPNQDIAINFDNIFNQMWKIY
jgi:phosphatidylserine/phosphatidylglycerophosphate/cardiolipin synthase-like enzyme